MIKRNEAIDLFGENDLEKIREKILNEEEDFLNNFVFDEPEVETRKPIKKKVVKEEEDKSEEEVEEVDEE